jgi:hypothetical protein
MSWFTNLKDCLEKMPDEPVWQVAAPWKKSVFEWYKGDCAEYPQYMKCSRSYFLTLWKDHFPEIKLRKWLRFSKCSTCAEFRRVRWARNTSATEKADAMIKLRSHYKFVKSERAYATAKANLAIERPTEALSIAIDGTDQLPKGLPQFSVDTSDEANKTDRIQVKFVLARVHGLATTCYDHGENIAGDPNLTIEIVQRSLKIAEKRLGKLPPELYIQLDNCFRENKNSYLMNYLGTLCERGLFPGGVYVSFLPKGHTHNEMDQVAAHHTPTSTHTHTVTHSHTHTHTHAHRSRPVCRSPFVAKQL